MEEFIFRKYKRKDNKISMPICYEKEENTIPGLYLTSSVRFYKRLVCDIVNYEYFRKKNPNLTSEQIRNLLRIFRAHMEDFKIKEKKVIMPDSKNINKPNYNFKSGIVVAKGKSYMDVVSFEKLDEFLEDYGFDLSCKEEILNNEVTSIVRKDTKELKYSLYFKKDTDN